MEEKNNLIENKKTDFMNGFKYEAKSTTLAFVGNFFSGFSSWFSSGASSESAVKDSDSSLKEQLAKFLSDQKVSIDIKSVRWVFKKLIEQNCVIGEETLKYLCDLCKKENQDKNSVENQKNKENNEKGNQNENGVENQLISTLLKTEYVYTDEEDKKQKIRKCVLTDSLFKKAVDLVNQKDFDTKENAGCVFQLVGNIIGGFLSQKNKVSYGDILGLVEKFGFDNTLKVLIDFFDKGDLNAVTVKIESLVVDNSINDKFGKMFPGMLKGYQSTFKNIQNNKSGNIGLESFIGYINTFYNDLTCNDQIKNDKDKLKLHRQFIFSILEKTLLKIPDNALDEEIKLMASWSDKMKNVIVGEEKNNNLKEKKNLDEEKNIIKEENNANKINVIKEPGNDNYDFIGTILTKVSSVISELSVDYLFIDKNQNPSVIVDNTKKENITASFLKAMWGKLEDKEKNHLKVLILPIVFKMFGKETWKKEILLHGLKIFGLGNFDQIDNKSLDLIFDSIVKIIDHLPNDKDSDESKKNKISTISSELKNVIDALFQANKNENLNQMKDSVDTLIDIVFSLPKEFKDKDGKVNFDQIVKFLYDINRDKEWQKWNALCEVIKPFLSDEKFLEKLITSIFEQKSDKKETKNKEINKEEHENKEKKETWKKEILISGLKFFAGKFDKLSNNIREILPDLLDLYKIFNEKPKKKDDKKAKNIDFAKIKNFLAVVTQNENKLKALNNLVKFFCSDENFLTNVADGILDKDSWQANILKHGLKLFGVRFDNLKDEDLKSILESVAKIIDHLPNDKDKDDQKKQKISVITEGTKKIFGILLVGKNGNKNFDGLAQNLIDILLNDDLSQVEIIGKVQEILKTVQDNFVRDGGNSNVFKSFVKAFLNNGDFLLGIVNGVETLKPVIKNDKVELEGLTDENRDKNWFVPVLDNLGKFLINDIDHSTEFVDHINKILGVYKEFAQAIDIPANAKCCKDSFLDLANNNANNILQPDDNFILQKINAVDSVKEKYDALKKFCGGKNKLVHDKNENKDDFKQVEKLYKSFMQEFYNSDIILTTEEQKKFNKFRFTFEINQAKAINSVKDILKTINEISRVMPENKRQESLACTKELLKSVIKDGRILKFITASDELKEIHPILSKAFKQLAKLVEIKIDNVDDFNTFITGDMNGLLDMYDKFASSLDSDSKNNPNYQTDIINSIQNMINYVEEKFLISNNEDSQNAYQNLLKAFFSSVKNEKKSSIMNNLVNIVLPDQNDPEEANILTFVIDKIDDKAMPKSSKRALKKSLICLMPLIKNSVEKKNFKDNLFQLFKSYKTLAKELDKSFNFQAAKNFVDTQNIKNKYAGNENLASTFNALSREINALVPDAKKIMHQYKLFRNKIQEISNTGDKSFELNVEQKNIFEKFEFDQSKAIPVIKNILISISNFCPSNKEIKNENKIINENNIDNKNDISVNNSIININTGNKNNELSNGNEKPFNMVLINLLQGGDFLKDIINGIDSDDDADMRADLKKYLASLSSPLCEFLISYLQQTKDNSEEIITKFDFVLSKYLEITDIIKAEKVNIAKLFKSVESLLRYLETEVVSKNTIAFNAYKNLFKNIAVRCDTAANENILVLLVKTIKQSLTNQELKEIGKYLNFVSRYTAPIFTNIASLIFDSTNEEYFFSKFVSKFEKTYSIFNTKKSFTKAVKSLFSSGTKKKNKTLEANLQPNKNNENENQIFKYILNKLEFERPPINQIENKKNDVIKNNGQDDLTDEHVIESLSTNNENIISTSSKPVSNSINNLDNTEILDEKKEIKNDDNDHNKTIYLSETLFANSLRITKWCVKKYFNTFKEYVQEAKDDDEMLTTLTNKIDLTNPMGKYVTFWRITNLLFWRKSKWYYPVVAGEIILSLTIFSPFVVPASFYSLGKYFWTWLFKKNDVPPNPPRELPPQHKNLRNQNIVIDTGMEENNEKNKTDEIIVFSNFEGKDDNGDSYIMPNSNNKEGISVSKF